MEIIIKKTNEADKSFAIAQKLPDFFDERGLKQIEQDTKTQLLYGAYVEGEMVGFVTYKEINSDTLEMTWLGVLPEMQNKKIGNKLVIESLKEAGEKYKVCEVKTLSETDPYEPYKKTREFYKSVGFIGIETIDPYPEWKDNPCQIFVKFIGK